MSKKDDPEMGNILWFSLDEKRMKTYCNKTRQGMRLEQHEEPKVIVAPTDVSYLHRIIFKLRQLYKTTVLLTASNQARW